MRFLNLRFDLFFLLFCLVSSETVYVTVSTTLWLPSPSPTGIPQITPTTAYPSVSTASFGISKTDFDTKSQIMELKGKITSGDSSEDLNTAVSEPTGSAYIQPFPPVTAKHIGIIWDFEKNGIPVKEDGGIKDVDHDVDVGFDTEVGETGEGQTQPELDHTEPEPQSENDPESLTEESNDSVNLNLNTDLSVDPGTHDQNTSLELSENIPGDSEDASSNSTLAPTPTEPLGSESEEEVGTPTELYDCSQISSDPEPPAPTSAPTSAPSPTSSFSAPSSLSSVYLPAVNGSRQFFQYSYPKNFLQRNQTQVSSASRVTSNFISQLREFWALLVEAAF